MGRTQAKGKVNRRTGAEIRPGLVTKLAHEDWMDKAGVEVRGGDLDESPLAYKRIEQVLQAHEGTIKVLHTLTPIGVCMADSRERDPYKD